MSECFLGQLTLRPFFENDIALMKRWLYTPHVAKWFHYPEEWIESLEDRFGEFSFITPLIAEYEGTPVGFCRYYDCYLAKDYPHWNEELPHPDHPNEIFSMDCLIGEPDCLGRGFGKQMTAVMLDKLREIGAKKVIIEPERENIASSRTLEANGFVFTGKTYILNFGGSNYAESND